MKKIYWTYRQKIFGRADYENITLNGSYDPSFFLNGMFSDYIKAWLTSIIDWENVIPEKRYTSEIAPWIKKLNRLIIAEYDEKFVDWNEFMQSIQSVGSEFSIKFFYTVDDARTWIRNNTNLVDNNDGVFMISESYIDHIAWEVPARYIIVD